MNNKNMPQADRVLMYRHLELLFPDGVVPRTEIHACVLGARCNRIRGLRSFEEVVRRIVELEEQDQPGFLGVVPSLYRCGNGDTFGRPSAAPFSTTEWLHSSRTLWVDLDWKPGPASRRHVGVAHRFLTAHFRWAPNYYTVGGGIHACWTLTESIPLHDDAGERLYRGHRAALNSALAGVGPWTRADKGALASVQPLRLAGTIHRKQEPRLVRLVEVHDALDS